MSQLLMFTTTFIIQFIIAMEMNFIGPLAPFLSTYFNIKDSQVIYFNLGYASVGLLVPLLGVWADRYGNKRIITYALLLFFAGSILGAFAPNPILFFLARILIGLGYFSLSGTTMSYISEFIDYRKRGQAAGILRTAFGIAIFTSPLYTAALTSRFDSLKGIYLPLSVLALVALLLLRKLPETEKVESSQLDVKEFVDLLKHPRTIKVLLSLFLVITAPTMFFNFLGLHLSSTFNLNQNQIGLTYALISAGSILGILVATLYADKYGKLSFSRVFFGIMIFSLLPIAYGKNMIIVVVLAFIFAFGLDGGWTSYQAFCSEIYPKKRSTFLSLFYTINALTIILFSVIGPFLYDIGGLKLTTGVGFVSLILASLLLFRLSRSPA